MEYWDEYLHVDLNQTFGRTTSRNGYIWMALSQSVENKKSKFNIHFVIVMNERHDLGITRTCNDKAR